ncbi:HigA family addiction module antitoxin [Flavobacterium sharifuzzamanii]|uniref:HigA family addiction module antitoxin n=1 Tax=Flavobacterium sharifuzzamanii TaxID=2211133 RepID=UPI000DAD7DFB|nr:HigA family addiction module antitoxin [Flavobacterium sharifuzzamanii]KAF2082014.1 HigA family addiction module antidote protein [Flavobacterium sharifuzzamanii]
MEKVMRNIHPGEILRMELVEGRKLTVSKIAELLDTSRSNMSNIINGKTCITPNMALKLEKVFGGSAKHFLALQSTYNLYKAKEKLNKNIS